MAAPANQSQAIEADVWMHPVSPCNDAQLTNTDLQPRADEYGSDYDSAASDTTSLASSLFHYTYENGRRYHPQRERDESYVGSHHHPAP